MMRLDARQSGISNQVTTYVESHQTRLNQPKYTWACSLEHTVHASCKRSKRHSLFFRMFRQLVAVTMGRMNGTFCSQSSSSSCCLLVMVIAIVRVIGNTICSIKCTLKLLRIANAAVSLWQPGENVTKSYCHSDCCSNKRIISNSQYYTRMSSANNEHFTTPCQSRILMDATRTSSTIQLL